MNVTKFSLIAALAMTGLAMVGAKPAVAQDGSAYCLQTRITLAEPKLIQVAPDQAMVRMKMTNNLSWPVRDVYMNYTIFSKSTGRVVRSDQVSLTVPGGLPTGQTREVQTGFFGFPDMESHLGTTSLMRGSAGAWNHRQIPANKANVQVSVADAADPNGDQVVRDIEIIGLGWTGRKSTRGCN